VPRWIPSELAQPPRGRLSRGYLRCPSPSQVFYTPGTAGPPETSGTLGQVPRVHVGSFDTRPWEEPYDSPRWNDWRREAKAVWGPSLTLRVIRRIDEALAAGGGPDGNVFRFAGNTLADATAYCTVLISTWNDPIGTTPGPPNTDPNAPIPLPAEGLWQRQTRVGPNIMPDLAGVGSADVDLLRYAAGARFIGVWLWYYWADLAAPTVPAISLAWEARDDSPANQQIAPCVSWPVDNVPGPGAGPGNAVFRYSRLPSSARHCLGVFNGGAAPIDVDFRQWVGANVLTVTAAAGILPAGNVKITSAAPDCNSHFSVQAEHTGGGAGTVGPVIFTLAANGVAGLGVP